MKVTRNKHESRETVRTEGYILVQSMPSLFIISRVQARSTRAGTPVKSWPAKRCQIPTVAQTAIEISFVT